MLITPEYIEQNRALHATGQYGVMGPEYLETLRGVATLNEVKTILDYGSGSHEWLKHNLGDAFAVQSYDPCLPGLDARPEPADFVVSLDVLEHIEPECLEAVLDDLRYLTKRLAFLTINTGPAWKTLPDGRNAHLIQEDERFWLPKLTARWKLQRYMMDGTSLCCVLSPRRNKEHA